MSSPETDPPDLTPESASPTDIAPLGRPAHKPAHERTGEEEAALANWEAIEADPAFISLLKAKARFIIPGTLFFVVYYFALPIGVGWFPSLMEKKVWGEMNIAYLFAFSQFIMAWVLALFYVIAASGWDKQASALVARFQNGECK